MGTVIAVAVSFIVITGLVLLAIRSISPDGETPRRRDLTRLRAERNAAETALHDIEAKLNGTGAIGLDIVGENLAGEIRKIITDHRRKTLENDK